MPFYKDSAGQLYFLDSGEYFNFLPSGCEEISEARYLSLLVPSPLEIAAGRRGEILNLLGQIDAKSIRPLREGDAAGVAALEAQAVPLRVELATL